LPPRGKDINFGFLWQRAGYDIDQQLIPYTNDSTHFRALIGLLNTLVVAFSAASSPPSLASSSGVLRLSKNWLVGG
jgi:general L-amino acid transport system permease protein